MRHSAPYPGGNRSDTIFLIPGTHFGKWTVLQDAAVRSDEGDMKSRVRCDCGRISLIKNRNLRSGRSKSCERCSRGFGRGVPIPPGSRFGRWTVIKDLGIRGNNRQRHSEVQCDCGRTFSVHNGNLRSGNSRGCRFCARGKKPDWQGLKARADQLGDWRGIKARTEGER